MNKNMWINAIENIDDLFIEEAEEKYNKVYKKRLIIGSSVAAVCLLLLLGGYLLLHGSQKAVRNALSVSAEELGKENYSFGISLPQIVYSDASTAILYDFRGIYVYDFAEEKLVGFADFRPVDMTRINGDAATCVEVSSDGKYVRAYSLPAFDQKQRFFLYDVEKNEFRQVEKYDDSDFEAYVQTEATDKISLSDYGLTYQQTDGAYIAVSLHINDDPEAYAVYGDLYLIRQDENGTRIYDIFK